MKIVSRKESEVVDWLDFNAENINKKEKKQKGREYMVYKEKEKWAGKNTHGILWKRNKEKQEKFYNYKYHL